ncbi:transcriptional regulator [Pseudonocardia sulfidoxydans NBRC 16205]|uniref:Transcriptional regulator n=1 Tax=Pseudonocardia sulfidoxydans NBRC 16205 TaxID=1223511 RepID=A0A511DHQ2_9PSEU|nr:WYL domain-containing protein [Pseudonocardia sulfidoxydans]GEL24326.1 transcriptional regulator [Pseudonocardia sulfidoxydans NBRC 16205]
MRASRLIALLFVLQRRRSATAAQLAVELEVSERTIYRDVAALVEAGVPLWTEGGHGGGIRLVDGWRTRLDGLTAQEAAAMLTTAAPQLLTALGMGSALVTAQSKMLATLPADLGEHARRIAERVHLDAPGWFRTPAEPAHLATLARAVWDQRRVRIGYRRGSGSVDRVVEPLGLVLKAGVWYLVAGVAGSADVRTYRASRVVDAEVTGERFERPEGFDLPGWWVESAARFAGSMLRETVRIRLTPRGLRALPHVTDADAATAAVAAAGPPDEEGRREVTLEVESIEVAAGQLVALAGEVEALDPGVRALLAAHARALLDNNS